jgi:hypothetical protein
MVILGGSRGIFGIIESLEGFGGAQEFKCYFGELRTDLQRLFEN